jgi:hypothetical protein
VLCLSTEYCEERARRQRVAVAIRKLAAVDESRLETSVRSCVAVCHSPWATCTIRALGVTLLSRRRCSSN